MANKIKRQRTYTKLSERYSLRKNGSKSYSYYVGLPLPIVEKLKEYGWDTKTRLEPVVIDGILMLKKVKK